MDSIPQKTCTRCGQTKPLTDFNRDKSRRDGYRDRCKNCIRDYQREWLPRYISQIQEQRQQIDPPAVKRCTQCGEEKPLTDYHQTPNTVDKRRPICNLCACDYQHDHRSDPRYAEKVREYDRLKYHTMPDELRRQMHKRGHERHKKRYWNDPVFREHERTRTGHKTNRRRLRKIGNGGSHTIQQWLELCVKYNHRCLCCGQRLPLTRDHIVPVESGGIDDIENIQPLCRSCNSAKGARTIDYRP